MRFPSPTDKLFVKQSNIAGQSKDFRKFTYQQKASSPKPHLMKLFNKLYHLSKDDLQTLTLTTLGFVDFLRWDDLT